MNKLHEMVSRLFGTAEHKVGLAVRDASHRLSNESMGLTASVNRLEQFANPLEELLTAMKRNGD